MSFGFGISTPVFSEMGSVGHSAGPQNTETLKLYNQFIIDTPRVDVFLDDKRYSGDSTTLFMELWASLQKAKAKATSSGFLAFEISRKIRSQSHCERGINSDDIDILPHHSQTQGQDDSELATLAANNMVAKSLTYCTQSILASYFQKACEKYCDKEDRHLVDGGRQTVRIVTKSLPQRIEIRKPFKVVKVDMETCTTPEIEKIVSLELTYDITNDETKEEWHQREPTPLDLTGPVDPDWVLI